MSSRPLLILKYNSAYIIYKWAIVVNVTSPQGKCYVSVLQNSYTNQQQLLLVHEHSFLILEFIQMCIFIHKWLRDKKKKKLEVEDH